MSNFISFLIERKDQIIELLMQHIILTLIAIIIAIIIGIPLGILVSRYKSLRKGILGIINIIQSIPSMALLGLLIPLLGIGSVPAITAVVLYSLLPIVKNTYTALSNINPDIIEAARGMGLTKRQVLVKIKIPLSLGVIMAGVRISAVTSVGLMTLAAFIGAGGLGNLVFTGVQTVNNNMILAGAIPACLLALFIDFLFGKIEVAVVPKGISTSKKKNTFTFKLILFMTVGIIILIVGLNIFKPKRDTIVVGSKNYTEQQILGNMFADILEGNTDLEVVQRENLGGSAIALSSIENGEIDVYPDYTGTLLQAVVKDVSIKDPTEVFNKCKEAMENNYNITLLDPLGFNNTYTMATTKEIAEKYNLKTISDLSKVSKELRLTSTMEFAEREDGLKGLNNTYGLKFKSVKGIDGGLRYSALDNGESDFIDAYSTEGLLKKFKLTILEDDKNFFLPYYAVPVIRQEIIDKHPEVKTVLEKLSGIINEDTMIDLNYKVDNEGVTPEKAARDFLIEQGLITE